MKQMSIKGRLIIALVVFITVFASFGAFSIMKVRELEKVTKSIYNDPLKVSSAAIEARVDVIKMQRKTRDILLRPTIDNIKEGEMELQVIEGRIYKNFDEIRSHAVNEDSLSLESKARENFIRWRKNHEQMFDDMQNGRMNEAIDMSQNINVALVDSIELSLRRIDNNAKNRAAELVNTSNEIQKQLETLLVILNIGLCIFFSILFGLVIRSIIKSINKLQNTMNKSAVTGILHEAEIEGSNEIAGIARYYNLLVQKLRNQFWLKDGENTLNHEIASSSDLSEMTQKALNFIVRTLGAGKGALYIYNESTKHLDLKASYAYTEKEQRFGSYALGEGIIGQVGMEKKPIYMENIRDYEGYIATGINLEAPINIYSFPLLLEETLIGVIELAAFETFDELKLELLQEASSIIAANVYSEIQNQKVKNLLEVSEKAQVEARYNASQLLKANQALEEQQLRLQQQSEELQQTNAELEEQQLLLQQQSEELQQTNLQLEEQQQILEEQTKLLNIRNEQLEESRLELLMHSKELEKANTYKSQFLANMSHELRTPLNSIILLSRLLMKNEKKELSRFHLEKMDVIYNSGQELLRLINDVLDLSKIEAGKMSLNKAEFHTQELLKNLKQMFEGMAQEKNISLSFSDEIKGQLFGDYNKIAQVTRNLVSNAIKFTDQGTVTVHLRADQEGNTLIQVSDTGIGISEENQKIIFEEFQQADGSISRRFGGTGLGLSISKRMAEVMDADILVESKEGKGSTFTLKLKKSSNSQMKKKDNTPPILGWEYKGSIVIEEAAAAKSDEKVILIIEDDKDFANFIKTINEGMGLETIMAFTGKEGLRLARSGEVDAILLDLMLPDITGLEVLRELKSTQELRSIPVHVISAKDKNAQPQSMGAVGYHQKPAGEDDIAAIISRMIDIKEKNPKRLLIVEDNEIQRQAMQELLGDDDIVIDAVNTEEAAKERIDNASYDAIILDLELVSGNGINICRYMESKKSETPVIIYTGRDLTPEQEKEIRRYTESIIIKTANSDDRLLDEVTLFLHKVKKSNEKTHYLISKTNKNYSLSLQGKNILIVDDDPRNIFVLASALEDFGANILEADNGKMALEVLEDNKVDLVLMDVMMPVMDGYQAIKAIRERADGKDIPIIAVTAKSLKEDRAKCIDAGANDYISKPVEYDTLIRLVKAWISK